MVKTRLGYVMPELGALKGIAQSPPHTKDVWEHTLSAVDQLSLVLRILGEPYDPERGGNLTLGLASGVLGRFREQIRQHLAQRLNPDRSLKGICMMAALYHDSAKPATRSQDKDGRIHNYEHELRGAELAEQRAVAMHLSNDEVGRLKLIVLGHMRPLHLINQAEPPTNRAIYRFFRNFGPGGVDICLFSLADTLATYGATLPETHWQKTLETIRLLLSAYWESPAEKIAPPALVNGNDLIEALHLTPGPIIGRLLEEIREAQVEGMVKSREDALRYATQQAGKT